MSQGHSLITHDDITRLLAAYDEIIPDVSKPEQRVNFGTSGHRGSSLRSSFNQAHIAAISQAVCEWRAKENITGPLFMGKDTHALSTPAWNTALQVLIANNVTVHIQTGDHPTPTPVISHAILCHNTTAPIKADGIVITPSHNPPLDGGFKYNEFNGGPANTNTTKWIQTRANELLADNNANVCSISLAKALASPLCQPTDYITHFVADLKNIINFEAIAKSQLKIAVDPLGGAGLPFWEPIAKAYNLNLTVVNNVIDPTFSFMTPDHDGVVRMDCSSPTVMQPLVHLASQYDLAFANDPDADRHGIITPEGLMNPNHYLSAAIWYLLNHRPQWKGRFAIGKTAVTTSLIDKICSAHKTPLFETPVGFKWFVDGMFSKTLVFGGEESAGASFLRFNMRPWSTDKDGIIMNLLAAEMTAVTGKNPAQIYQELTQTYGTPFYTRLDAPASTQQKKAFAALTATAISLNSLAESPVLRIQTNAQGNNAPIGGFKVVAQDGWFAARPSGTEEIYKIYAESFLSHDHLMHIIDDAKKLVASIFAKTAEAPLHGE